MKKEICFFVIIMSCLIGISAITTTGSTTTSGTTTTAIATTTSIPPGGGSTTSITTTTTTASAAKVEILGGGFSNGLWHPVPQLPAVNRALVFIAFAERSGPTTLNSVTYGGRPMTKIIQRNVGTTYAQNYVAAFILNDAGIAAATDDHFAVSWSGVPSEVEYGHVFLQNVNQSVLTGAKASRATATGFPNPITTSALFTCNGDMVFAAAECGNSGIYTMNNGFSRWFAYRLTSSSGAVGIKSATGAKETPSATFSGTLSRQAIIGFVVRH
ncbi:MAG: hypothetical protein JW749_03305 [Sedimentisphaerales bacterium]|nr:hypothetical protein [Sedimentisphaerales bacterium]